MEPDRNPLAGSPGKPNSDTREFFVSGVMVSSDVVAVVDGQGVQVYVMDADGSGRTRLTDNPAADASPSWSMQ